MAYKIVVGKMALDDVRRAADWYAGESVAAVERFLDAFDERMADLAARPTSFSPLRQNQNYRRARLRHFPYLMIFRINEAQKRVFISAVVHEKRNPASWVRQLR